MVGRGLGRKSVHGPGLIVAFIYSHTEMFQLVSHNADGRSLWDFYSSTRLACDDWGKTATSDGVLGRPWVGPGRSVMDKNVVFILRGPWKRLLSAVPSPLIMASGGVNNTPPHPMRKITSGIIAPLPTFFLPENEDLGAYFSITDYASLC